MMQKILACGNFFAKNIYRNEIGINDTRRNLFSNIVYSNLQFFRYFNHENKNQIKNNKLNIRNVLVLEKLTRFEVEVLSGHNPSWLAENFPSMLESYLLHKFSVTVLSELLREKYKVNVSQIKAQSNVLPKINRKDAVIPPDAIFCAGGDGTFLEACSMIAPVEDSNNELNAYIFGINSDPIRSEGKLCMNNDLHSKIKLMNSKENQEKTSNLFLKSRKTCRKYFDEESIYENISNEDFEPKLDHETVMANNVDKNNENDHLQKQLLKVNRKQKSSVCHFDKNVENISKYIHDVCVDLVENTSEDSISKRTGDGEENVTDGDLHDHFHINKTAISRRRALESVTQNIHLLDESIRVLQKEIIEKHLENLLDVENNNTVLFKRQLIRITFRDQYNNITNVCENLALNEVVFGENLFHKTLNFRIGFKDHTEDKLDSSYKFKFFKSSGLIISTGTGSGAWLYNSVKISKHGLCRILHMLKKTASNLKLYDIDLNDMLNQCNKDVLFSPTANYMKYVVREPIESRVTECDGAAGITNSIIFTTFSHDTHICIDGVHTIHIPLGHSAQMDVIPTECIITA